MDRRRTQDERDRALGAAVRTALRSISLDYLRGLVAIHRAGGRITAEVVFSAIVDAFEREKLDDDERAALELAAATSMDGPEMMPTEVAPCQ